MQHKLLIYEWESLSEPAFCKAVKQNGWEYREFKKQMKNYHADAEFAQELMELLQRESFDAVFSYDYFPLISLICDIRKIPYVSWIYDCPMYTLQSETLKNPYNYIFCFDRNYSERLSKMGAVNCFHFPLAGTGSQLVEIEKKEQEDAKLREKYQCDISFVGNFYNGDSNRLYRAKLSDYTTGFVKGLTEAQLLVYGYNFIRDSLSVPMAEEIIEKCQLTLGNGYRQNPLQMAADAVGMEVTRKERQRVLELIGDRYEAHVYTASELPDSLLRDSIKNMGYANYDKDLPFIFHNSKINLNITLRTIESGIPQRVFDILSCGGFCLTNYQPEVDEFFIDGQELVMYTDMKDMLYKIGYYLNHEEERQQIAENGYQKICEQFDLKDRISDMLQCVFEEC